MTYLPAIVCVAYYFDQKRSLAIGIACCGSGVGTLVFGAFAGWLLENYGWRGGMLIEAGLVLNCCALGLIFVEPTLPERKRQPAPSDNAAGDVKYSVAASGDATHKTNGGGAKYDSDEALAMIRADVEGGHDGALSKESKSKDKNLSRSVLNLPNFHSNPNLYDGTPDTPGNMFIIFFDLDCFPTDYLKNKTFQA